MEILHCAAVVQTVVAEMKVVVVDWVELAVVAPGFSAPDIFSDEQPALHIKDFL